MPNHVTNILKVGGKGAAKVLEAIKGENGLIDFEKILPMPAELHGLTSPARIVFAVDYDAEVAKAKEQAEKFPGFGLSLPQTDEMSRDFVRRFGANNWYDWSIKNWGTKWNAYSISADGKKIRFDTAWSTPYPVMEALSRKFPDAKITVRYADEDIGHNCGEYTLLCGEVIAEIKPEGGTPKARRFALRVKGGR